ncbi:DUF262 domain-containing protein [Flagellimonas sp.]|jgi:hypothetical protein|uniref:DUF262 domain-containing protein n=1 Tax=Flagellimonas sp. TaxID=2058762 RepID=UPI003BA980C9
MARQIQSSPSNKRISELYRRIKEGSLIPQPDFQRKFVWTKDHKESFIETILQGLPFPEIYLAQTGIDMEKIVSTEVVVDGQQRLSTIVQYIEEKKESKEFGKKVPLFGELSTPEQEDFLNYLIVVRDLGDVSSDMIKEIFQRINKTKFSLEQIEIHNAVYDGVFISTAKEILEEIDKEHIPIFSDSELTRMADLHFVLLIMSTIESGGYFPFDKEIEKFVQEYNNEYPNANNVKRSILGAFEQIKNFEFEPDSLWYRKSNFFTLVVELSRNNYPDTIKTKLLDLEQQIIENKQKPKGENQFSTYYSYMYTGTNSRQARVVRSEILLKEI